MPEVFPAVPCRKTGPQAAAGQEAYLPLARPWYHWSVKSVSTEATAGGDQIAPVLRHLLALLAGQVDGHRLLAVELERLGAQLPHVGDDLTGLAGGHVDQVALRVLGVVRLRGGGEVVPGLGRLDAGVGEQVLAVEQPHRAGVLRHAPEAVVGVDLAPHPLRELRGDVGGGVRRQVEQGAVTQRERRDELELHLRDVGSALSGLDGRPQLLVVRSALADVDDVDLDLGVRLMNRSTWFLMSGTQVQKVKVVSVSMAVSMSDCGICEAEACGVPPPESPRCSLPAARHWWPRRPYR